MQSTNDKKPRNFGRKKGLEKQEEKNENTINQEELCFQVVMVLSGQKNMAFAEKYEGRAATRRGLRKKTCFHITSVEKV